MSFRYGSIRCRVALLVVSLLIGCIGCSRSYSTEKEIRRFEMAGPIIPQVDKNSLVRATKLTGYYRVVPGDLLSIEMSAILRVVSSDITKWFVPTGTSSSERYIEAYDYRISDEGTITLPIVGELSVVGQRTPEIEKTIVHAYYPKYVQTVPSVVCRIKEYQAAHVKVTGGVNSPGIYELKSNELSLVAVLMKAGGIVEEGAGLITIEHALHDQDQERLDDPEPIVIPVKELNIPFVDVSLQDGDAVEVFKFNPEVLTVMGVVKDPGVFPYPPDVDYYLPQALAFAGGPDLSLSPHYLTVYRQDQDGQIVSVSFGIDTKSLMKASRIKLKPGDVVAVEETLITHTRRLIKEIVSIRLTYDIRELIE